MMQTGTQAKRTPLEVSKLVLDAAFKIHSHFGPGLLESVYEACLAQELKDAGLNVQTQVPVPVIFNSVKLEAGYRIDVVVENADLVAIKNLAAVDLVDLV